MTAADRVIVQPRVLLPFILVTLIWGSTWLAIKGQLGTVPPAWSISYRFALGAGTMFVFAAMRGQSLRIDPHGHLLAAGFGLPQFFINFNCVYFAEQHVTSGLVAVVFALLLVPNSLLAWLFLGHRISGRFLAGSLVAVAGVTLLFLQELRASRAASADIAVGLGLAVTGMLAASLANIVLAGEPMRARALPTMTAWGMAYGAVANALVGLLVYGQPRIETDPLYLGSLAYLGLVASALPFGLYFAIIRDIGPGRAAYTSLIIPIIAMALSTIFESYAWSAAAAAGTALSLIGLFIALRARRADTASA